jgi:hypothetical protein
VPPTWTDEAERDPGVALVELLAYAADLLSYYYQDQVANKSQLRARRFCNLDARRGRDSLLLAAPQTDDR